MKSQSLGKDSSNGLMNNPCRWGVAAAISTARGLNICRGGLNTWQYSGRSLFRSITLPAHPTD
jgi:hypothetical protein